MNGEWSERRLEYEAKNKSWRSRNSEKSNYVFGEFEKNHRGESGEKKLMWEKYTNKIDRKLINGYISLVRKG